MTNVITLSQEEHEEFLGLYSAVLDWKNARFTCQLLMAQQDTAEKIAQANHRFMECERALSKVASSKLLQRALLASMGMEPADSDGAV